MYLLNCETCRKVTEHEFSEEHPTMHRNEGAKKETDCLEHMYRCGQCGTVRRYGLASVHSRAR